MIFILTEQVINGTVTMSTSVTGIRAKTFKEAVNKIKAKLEALPKSAKAMKHKDDQWAFRYTTQGDTLSLYGNIERAPLKMWKD